MPRLASSSPAGWASASTRNAWAGCSGRAKANARSSTSWSWGSRARCAPPRGGGSVLLQQADLPLRLLDDRAYIDFLGVQDEPWLRVLIAEMRRFEGRRRRELAERLAEPLPCVAPHFKRRAASRVLMRLWRRTDTPPLPWQGRRPSELRAELFGAAAASDAPSATIVAETAGRLNLTCDELHARLFADLAAERPVRTPDPVPSPGEVVLHTNLAIAQAVLM